MAACVLQGEIDIVQAPEQSLMRCRLHLKGHLRAVGGGDVACL